MLMFIETIWVNCFNTKHIACVFFINQNYYYFPYNTQSNPVYADLLLSVSFIMLSQCDTNPQHIRTMNHRVRELHNT